ncbi:MAG: isocitrate lyase/PEP mutase family protein [Thermodesulfobacteriota bacterium]
MKRTKILRELLTHKRLLVKPSGFDALSAKIIEQAGFKVMGATGYGISAAQLGRPDAGFLTLTEVVAVTRQMVGATKIPIICDADTGFGNALNVMRTTEEFIMAGAAGIHIEDQVAPKRCGHVAGKQLISLEEAVGKFRAADRVRRELDPDFLIIARTDARGALGGGMDEVIRRGKAYMAAGADMIFPDGLTSLQELERCVKEIAAPIHYNMSAVGVSFYARLSQLEEMGVAIVSNPGGLLRSAMKAMWDYAQGFAAEGTEFMIRADREFDSHPTGNLHAFMGFPEIRRLEEEFLPKEETQKKYSDSIGYQP